MSKLSDKHKLFADNYLIHADATRAALESGYSKKSAGKIGHQLLGKPKIQAYLNSKRKLREEKTQITQEWVLKNLKKVYKRCMQAIPVRDHDGNETGEYKFEPASANRSLELIGKHLGMFNKIELTGVNGGPIKLISREMTAKEASQIYNENLKK